MAMAAAAMAPNGSATETDNLFDDLESPRDLALAQKDGSVAYQPSKMQHHAAAKWRRAMLEQIDTLPRSQGHASVNHGMESDVCVNAERMCAGMSSEPSVVCR
jgi:hypothetical protein